MDPGAVPGASTTLRSSSFGWQATLKRAAQDDGGEIGSTRAVKKMFLPGMISAGLGSNQTNANDNNPVVALVAKVANDNSAYAQAA